MSFWKKKDNLIITGFVAAFFVGLFVWYDFCCLNASFFSSKAEDPYSVSFVDQNDQKISLAQFKGKPVIVYVWATWCPSCVKKMGTLNTFAGKFEALGGKVVPISQDKGGVSTVRSYFARHDYKNLGIYVEPTGSITGALKITGLPTAIFIDAQGKEVGRFAGGVDWESDKIADLVQQYFGLSLSK